VHPGDGDARLHAQVHNAYGLLMARATYEALRRLRPERRPFVISRSGYAGLQRYALHWTGDNSSWWEHLAMAMPQLQNLGLSGLAWVGVDVGGFSDDATGELLVRWTEMGIFQPFCRNHSHHGARRQEPWAFGEPYESHIRSLLKQRQRLIPYLYSLFDACHRTGTPILRPLLFEWPDDPTTYHMDDEFLLGPALLVAPIVRRGAEHRYVYLPRGTWHQFWTNEPIAGPAHVLAHAPLGRPAVYVRANSPIPLGEARPFEGERNADALTLLIYASAVGEDSFEVYDDAGDGYAHERGAYARLPVRCLTVDDRVTVTIGPRSGAFRPSWRTIRLDLRGMGRPPAVVRVDGQSTHAWQFESGSLLLDLPGNATACVVEVERS
jgi:alpha-glucosidase